MTNRRLLALTLAVTSFVSINGFSADAPNPSNKDGGGSQASSNVPDRLLLSASNAENSSRHNPNWNPDFPELAQVFVPIATACYTYVGRVCPMGVVLPVGTACTCYYGDGAFAGIAR